MSIFFAVSALGLISWLNFFINKLATQIQLKDSPDFDEKWYYGSIVYIIVTGLIVIGYIGYVSQQNCY